MRRLHEFVKQDLGLVPQAINNTNVTGAYFAMSNYGRLQARLLAGAMAATKTAKIELLQATDSAGTGAKAIGTGISATVTANTLVHKATVALAAAANTDTVTINGTVYTMAAATDATANEFADAAGLVVCVNHATYGVDGVFASASGTDVTLVARPAGDVAITVAGGNVAGTVTVATTEAMAYVDLDVNELDLANDFYYVGVKVTVTANGIFAADVSRYACRRTPTQKVGASGML